MEDRTLTVEITRHVVSYRTPPRVLRGVDYGSKWLDGDSRSLSRPETERHTADADDLELYDGDPVAWAVDVIGRTDATEPSCSPIGDALREHDWLSGTYYDPYQGDSRVTETTARLTGDWTPQERARVFREVSGQS